MVVHLKTQQGDTAEVSEYGGHITAWKNAKGEDLLFLSEKAIFTPPKAIRGGVPVCFPQFSDFGPMGQHGFARNVTWTVTDQQPWSVTLKLAYDGKSQPLFPHPFELTTTVALCESNLLQTLHVSNTGTESLTFTAALHTYFSVKDIAHARVEGLSGTYLDNLAGRNKVEQPAGPVTFDREVDRIYPGAPDLIKVHDDAVHRVIEIRKSNFPDAVVWNPWIDKAKSTADFGDDEYLRMLCVEPAVAASGAITLQAGEEWMAKQSLTVVDSSSSSSSDKTAAL